MGVRLNYITAPNYKTLFSLRRTAINFSNLIRINSWFADSCLLGETTKDCFVHAQGEWLTEQRHTHGIKVYTEKLADVWLFRTSQLVFWVTQPYSTQWTELDTCCWKQNKTGKTKWDWINHTLKAQSWSSWARSDVWGHRGWKVKVIWCQWEKRWVRSTQRSL